LHKTYADKRIRGEWFNLTEEDLFNISCYFYEAKKLTTGKSDYEESDFYKRKLQTEEKIRQSEELAEQANWLDFAVEGFGYEIF
jgi:hypothetical protein